jgi:hypothetical protein
MPGWITELLANVSGADGEVGREALKLAEKAIELGRMVGAAEERERVRRILEAGIAAKRFDQSMYLALSTNMDAIEALSRLAAGHATHSAPC